MGFVDAMTDPNPIQYTKCDTYIYGKNTKIKIGSKLVRHKISRLLLLLFLPLFSTWACSLCSSVKVREKEQVSFKKEADDDKARGGGLLRTPVVSNMSQGFGTLSNS